MSETPKQAPANPVPTISPRARDVSHRIIQANELSEQERRLMEQRFGYDGNSPVPSDLAERMEAAGVAVDPQEHAQALQAAVAAASEAAPPPMAAPTGLDFSKIETQQIDHLPEDLMEKFNRVQQLASQPNPSAKAASDVFEQIRQAGVQEIRQASSDAGVHPDVARAFNEVDEDRVERVDVPKTAVEAAAADGKTEADEKKRQYELLLEVVDEADQQEFCDAICTMRLFKKTYTLLGGRIKLTFGDTTQEGDEAIAAQCSIDRQKGRIGRDVTVSLMASRSYSLASMLYSVTIDGKEVIHIPGQKTVGDFLQGIDPKAYTLDGVDADDTNLRFWSRFLQTSVLQGTVKTLVMDTFGQFQALLANLHRLSRYPEFFRDPTQ